MVKRQPLFVNTPAQTTPGGSTSPTTRHFSLSILQSVPRSRELIQSCSPSQASACGVIVGELNRRFSIIDAFVISKTQLSTTPVRLGLNFCLICSTSSSVPLLVQW